MPFVYALALLALFVGSAAPLWAPSAHAQASATVHITDVVGPSEVTDTTGLSALAVEMSFTLLGQDGRVMQGVSVETAEFALDDGRTFTAQVGEASAPWSVVFLVDVSKNMVAAAATAKDARAKLAELTALVPDGSNLAVMSFGSLPATVQDFTKSRDLIAEAIRKNVEPDRANNACLNDGAYAAVNKLAAASGRRALVLLTASADDCGTRLPQQVVDLATRNHIQIYAVGLRNATVQLNDLQTFTTPTRGMAEMGANSDEFHFAFENALLTLSRQWRASANLYPSSGNRQAVLNVTLQGTIVVESPPVAFEASKDYVQPVQIAFKGVAIPTDQGISFNVDLISVDLIQQFRITILSTLTGLPVNEQVLPAVQEQYPDVPVVLNAGENYVLVLAALDANGVKLAEIQQDFEYVPPPPQLAVSALTLPGEADVEPSVGITVTSRNLGDVAGFKLWLVPEGSDVPVPETMRTLARNVPLVIPLPEALPPGAYQVVVQALRQGEAGDEVITGAVSDPFIYQPPTQWQQTLRYIRETPAVIAGIGLVSGLTCVGMLVVAAVVVGMARGRRSGPTKAVDLALPEVKRRAAPLIHDATSNQRPAAPGGGRPERREPRPVPRPEPKPVPRPEPKPVPRQEAREAPRRDESYPVPLSEPMPVAKPEPRPEPRREAAAQGDLTSLGDEGAGMPPAGLEGQAPDDLRVSADVTRTPFTIGRRAGNDLALAVDNRLGVSGRHATISFEGGRFFITDDKSTYGTLVDGQRLPPGARAPLADGALIGLGPKVKLKFRVKR
jgi:hypothetical protein